MRPTLILLLVFCVVALAVGVSGWLLWRLYRRLQTIEREQAELQAVIDRRIGRLQHGIVQPSKRSNSDPEALPERTGHGTTTVNALAARAGDAVPTSLAGLITAAGVGRYCEPVAYARQRDGLGRSPRRIKLPGDRSLLVAQAPPADGGEAQAAATTSESELEAGIDHLTALMEKQADDSQPDFGVLYVADGKALASTLQGKPELEQRARARNIVFASPKRLLAMLRTVAQGWRDQAIVATVDQLRHQAEILQGYLLRSGDAARRITGKDQAQ